MVSILQRCLAATCLDWLMNDVLNCWLSCSCIWQLGSWSQDCCYFRTGHHCSSRCAWKTNQLCYNTGQPKAPVWPERQTLTPAGMHFNVSVFLTDVRSSDAGLKVRLVKNTPKVHKSTWGRVGIVLYELDLLIILIPL